MSVEDSASDQQDSQNRRGLILRILYRVYTNYLGVTPPTPAQERIAAVVVVGGVILGLSAIVVMVFLLWQWMTKMGAS